MFFFLLHTNSPVGGGEKSNKKSSTCKMCPLSSVSDFFISDGSGRIRSGQSHSDSHCGGGTGAEGWSVSPGRGAAGSVRGKHGEWRAQEK